MAKTVEVARLDIDVDALTKKLTDYKTEIKSLTEANKELKKSGNETSKEFVENEQRIRALRKEYNAHGKILEVVSGTNAKLTKEMGRQVKSIQDARDNNAELRKIRNLLNADTKEGAKQIAEINKRLDQNNKFITKNSSAYEKQKRNIGAYESAIRKAKVGAQAFGAALKALGIGLIVAAVTKLTSAFGRNQKVMDTVNTVFNAIGIVFDKVVGSIVDAVEATFKATGGFDALQRVMGNLLNLVLTPFKAAFFGIKLAIQEGQLAWEKSFFGGKDADRIKELTADVNETKDTLREIGEEAIESGKAIVDDFGEAIGEVGALGTAVSASTVEAIKSIDFKEVIKDAKALTEARKNTEALIIAQERLILQYETQAERLRQIRDDELNSIDDRKKANEELGSLLEKQAEAERKIINFRIAAAQREVRLNAGNIEAQNEVLRLKNELLQVDDRLATAQSEKLSNDNSLRNEELQQIKEFEDRKRKLQDEFDLANLESEREIAELKLQREFEAQEAELERLTLNEEQKTELRGLLEQNKQQQLAEIQNTFREQEREADVALQQSKIDARRKTLDAIIGLTDKETAIGKAAIVARQVLALQELAIESGLFSSKAALKASEAGVDIAAGTAKTASSVPFPANIPLIAGFIAQTAGIVTSIKSALSGKPKFAKGGVLRGPSHDRGGILTPYGELEGGEAVINKNSTRKYRGLLSMINQAGGGKKFESGGILGSNNPLTQSGFTSSSAARSIGFGIDYERLGAEVAKANMSLPPPVTDIRDFYDVNDTVTTIVEGANV